MPDPRAASAEWFVTTIWQNPCQWKGSFGATVAKQHDVRIPVGVQVCTLEGNADNFDEVRCEQCGKTFAGTHGLRSHRTRMHGFSNKFRFNLCSTICLSCGRDFHSAKRIHVHIAYSSAQCREVYETALDVSPEISRKFWNSPRPCDSKSLHTPPTRVDGRGASACQLHR